MENQKEELPGLTDEIKDYIETSIKLARYQAIDKGTSLAASVATNLFVGICLSLTFLLGTISVALLIGKMLNSYWEGFGIVMLVYLVLALIISACKTKYIKPRIVNFLIREIFKNEEDAKRD